MGQFVQLPLGQRSEQLLRAVRRGHRQPRTVAGALVRPRGGRRLPGALRLGPGAAAVPRREPPHHLHPPAAVAADGHQARGLPLQQRAGQGTRGPVAARAEGERHHGAPDPPDAASARSREEEDAVAAAGDVLAAAGHADHLAAAGVSRQGQEQEAVAGEDEDVLREDAVPAEVERDRQRRDHSAGVAEDGQVEVDVDADADAQDQPAASGGTASGAGAEGVRTDPADEVFGGYDGHEAVAVRTKTRGIVVVVIVLDGVQELG